MDRCRVFRDHALFVGRDHEDRDFRPWRADDLGVRRVGRRIEAHAEPLQSGKRFLTHVGAVFAYAGGEDERVEAAERGGERADLAAQAVDEIIEGLASGGRAGGFSSRMSLLMPDMPFKPEWL